jgi:hypothetical protein
MIWHIRIGKLPWCKAPYSRRCDLALLAHTEGLALCCSHTSKQKCVKLVEFLQRNGIDFARAVEGGCVHQHD